METKNLEVLVTCRRVCEAVYFRRIAFCIEVFWVFQLESHLLVPLLCQVGNRFFPRLVLELCVPLTNYMTRLAVPIILSLVGASALALKEY